jgi:hypothetical protein
LYIAAVDDEMIVGKPVALLDMVEQMIEDNDALDDKDGMNVGL